MAAPARAPLAKIEARPPAPVVEREVQAHREILKGHRGVLNDHERRVTALEALEAEVRDLRQLAHELMNELTKRLSA